jgi:hypothetical protein
MINYEIEFNLTLKGNKGNGRINLSALSLQAAIDKLKTMFEGAQADLTILSVNQI